MHLVLLRLSALGDILRVLPAWWNLHEAFPDARLQAVVEDRHAFLLEPLPWLEPVVVRRKELSDPFKAMRELKAVAAQLRRADASLDFHGILKSALIPKFAKIEERWGDGVTKEGAGWMQNHPLPWSHQTRYHQALGLSQAFGESRGVSGLGRFRPALKDAQLPSAGDIWTSNEQSRLVLVPGASRRGAHKRWPLRHWMRLARLLQGKAELRWSLGPEEEELRAWLPAETGVPALPPLGLWPLAASFQLIPGCCTSRSCWGCQSRRSMVPRIPWCRAFQKARARCCARTSAVPPAVIGSASAGSVWRNWNRKL